MSSGSSVNSNSSVSMVGSNIWLADDFTVWKLATIKQDHKTSGVVDVEAEDGNHYTIDKKTLIPANANDLRIGINDLSQLSQVHDAPIIHTLRTRYAEDAFFTQAGNILVSINPYKYVTDAFENPKQYFKLTQEISKVAKSEEDAFDAGSYRDDGTLASGEPHLYSLANRILNLLLQRDNSKRVNPLSFELGSSGNDSTAPTRTDQILLLSGESGSGKTELAKFAMDFFANANLEMINRTPPTARPSIKSDWVTLLTEGNVVLEAFGHARTAHNTNATRIAKLTRAWYYGNFIVACTHSVFHLERSRVLAGPPNERNFHIFYQFVRGIVHSQPDVAQQLRIRQVQDFKMLTDSQDSTLNTEQDDVDDFLSLEESFSVLGFTEDEKVCIWELLGALLHMGNFAFVRLTKDDSVAIRSPLMSVEDVCLLLGIRGEEFVRCAKTNLMTVSGRKTVIIDTPTPENTRNNVLAVLKYLYWRLYLWIVRKVNSVLCRDVNKQTRLQSVNFIGVIDTFGFESLDNNSLDQLCINYTNERLQNIFRERLIGNQSVSNSNTYALSTQVIDVIDRKATGLLALLEEHSQLNKLPDDKTLLRIFNQNHDKDLPGGKSPTKSGPYSKSRFGNDGFIVKHFAGSVSYTIDGFLLKNSDTLQPEMASLLSTSLNRFVVGIISDIALESTETGYLPPPPEFAEGTLELMKPAGNTASVSPRATGARATSISSSAVQTSPLISLALKDGVMALVSIINSSEVHVVKCIKPNCEKISSMFSSDLIIQQLHSNGIIDALISNMQGFQCKVTYIDFYASYRELSLTALTTEDANDVAKLKLAVQAIAAKYLVPPNSYRLENSYILLKADYRTELEKALVRVRRSALVLRSALQRRHMYHVCQAVLVKLREEKAEEDRIRAEENHRKELEEQARIAQELEEEKKRQLAAELKRISEEKAALAAQELEQQARMLKLQQDSLAKLKKRHTLSPSDGSDSGLSPAGSTSNIVMPASAHFAMSPLSNLFKTVDTHDSAEATVELPHLIETGTQSTSSSSSLVTPNITLPTSIKQKKTSYPVRIGQQRFVKPYRVGGVTHSPHASYGQPRTRALTVVVRNYLFLCRVWALMAACESGEVMWVRLLLGKNPADKHLFVSGLGFCSVYHAAVRGGSIETLEALGVDETALLSQHARYGSLMHFAVSKNAKLSMLQYMIDKLSLAYSATLNKAPDMSLLNSFGALPALKSGWLYKKNSTRTWVMRWVELKPKLIGYSKKEGEKEADAFLLQRSCSSYSRKTGESSVFTISLRPELMISSSKKNRKHVTFRAAGENELQEWLKNLSQYSTLSSFRADKTKSYYYYNYDRRCEVASAASHRGSYLLHALASWRRTSNSNVNDIYNMCAMAMWLVTTGCPINAKDESRKTALFIAVENCNFELAKCLIRAGADTSSPPGFKSIWAMSLGALVAPDKESLGVIGSVGAQKIISKFKPPKWSFGYHYIAVHLQMNGTLLGDEIAFTDIENLFLTVCLTTEDELLIEPIQEFAHPAVLTKSIIWWGQTCYFQTPLETLPSQFLLVVMLRSRPTAASVAESTTLCWGYHRVDQESIDVDYLTINFMDGNVNLIDEGLGLCPLNGAYVDLDLSIQQRRHNSALAAGEISTTATTLTSRYQKLEQENALKRQVLPANAAEEAEARRERAIAQLPRVVHGDSIPPPSILDIEHANNVLLFPHQRKSLSAAREANQRSDNLVQEPQPQLNSSSRSQSGSDLMAPDLPAVSLHRILSSSTLKLSESSDNLVQETQPQLNSSSRTQSSSDLMAPDLPANSMHRIMSSSTMKLSDNSNEQPSTPIATQRTAQSPSTFDESLGPVSSGELEQLPTSTVRVLVPNLQLNTVVSKPTLQIITNFSEMDDGIPSSQVNSTQEIPRPNPSPKTPVTNSNIRLATPNASSSPRDVMKGGRSVTFHLDVNDAKPDSIPPIVGSSPKSTGRIIPDDDVTIAFQQSQPLNFVLRDTSPALAQSLQAVSSVDVIPAALSPKHELVRERSLHSYDSFLTAAEIAEQIALKLQNRNINSVIKEAQFDSSSHLLPPLMLSPQPSVRVSARVSPRNSGSDTSRIRDFIDAELDLIPYPRLDKSVAKMIRSGTQVLKRYDSHFDTMEANADVIVKIVDSVRRTNHKAGINEQPNDFNPKMLKKTSSYFNRKQLAKSKAIAQLEDNSSDSSSDSNDSIENSAGLIATMSPGIPDRSSKTGDSSPSPSPRQDVRVVGPRFSPAASLAKTKSARFFTPRSTKVSSSPKGLGFHFGFGSLSNLVSSSLQSASGGGRNLPRHKKPVHLGLHRIPSKIGFEERKEESMVNNPEIRLNALLLKIRRPLLNFVLRRRLKQLFDACELGAVDEVKQFLKRHSEYKYILNARDGFKSVYHAAVRGSQIRVLKILGVLPEAVLHASAEIGALIHYAAENNVRVSMLKYLVTMLTLHTSNCNFNEADTLTVNTNLISGWLYKLNRGRSLSRWSRRWVVLTDAGLQYYLYPDDTNACDFYPLNKAFASFKIVDHSNTIVITLIKRRSTLKKRRILTLKAENKSCLQEWVKYLTASTRMEPFRDPSWQPYSALFQEALVETVSSQDDYGDTPLHCLARINLDEVDSKPGFDPKLNLIANTMWLLNCGCPLNKTNKEKKSAIFVAAECGNTEYAKFLQSISRIEYPVFEFGRTYVSIHFQLQGSIPRILPKQTRGQYYRLTRFDYLGDLELTVSVLDSDFSQLQQDTIFTKPAYVQPSYIWWGKSWNLTTPLEKLTSECVILVSLRSKSIESGALSGILCWAVMRLNRDTIQSSIEVLKFCTGPIDLTKIGASSTNQNGAFLDCDVSIMRRADTMVENPEVAKIKRTAPVIPHKPSSENLNVGEFETPIKEFSASAKIRKQQSESLLNLDDEEYVQRIMSTPVKTPDPNVAPVSLKLFATDNPLEKFQSTVKTRKSLISSIPQSPLVSDSSERDAMSSLVTPKGVEAAFPDVEENTTAPLDNSGDAHTDVSLVTPSKPANGNINAVPDGVGTPATPADETASQKSERRRSTIILPRPRAKSVIVSPFSLNVKELPVTGLEGEVATSSAQKAPVVAFGENRNLSMTSSEAGSSNDSRRSLRRRSSISRLMFGAVEAPGPDAMSSPTINQSKSIRSVSSMLTKGLAQRRPRTSINPYFTFSQPNEFEKLLGRKQDSTASAALAENVAVPIALDHAKSNDQPTAVTALATAATSPSRRSSISSGIAPSNRPNALQPKQVPPIGSATSAGNSSQHDNSAKKGSASRSQTTTDHTLNKSSKQLWKDPKTSMAGVPLVRTLQFVDGVHNAVHLMVRLPDKAKPGLLISNIGGRKDRSIIVPNGLTAGDVVIIVAVP